MTTRAEAKEQTRLALIRAAMEVFREHGIEGSSLDAICERAGKTRGAFYVHFADRADLQVAVMESILQEYVAIMVQTADPAGDLDSSLDSFVGAVLDARSDSPLAVLGSDQLRLLLQGVHGNPRIAERFRALVLLAHMQLAAAIGAAQAGGRIRADVDPAALASVLVTQVFGVMATLETGVTSTEQVQRAVDLVRLLLAPSP